MKLRNTLFPFLWLHCMFKVHLHRLHKNFLLKELLSQIVHLMLIFHQLQLVLLLLVRIIHPMCHKFLQFHIISHLYLTMLLLPHLYHSHIMLLDMDMVLLVLLIHPVLSHRIQCLLLNHIFSKDLTMAVHKETMRVIDSIKAEAIMEDISKEDGLVILILDLTCSLSVRFVNEEDILFQTVSTKIQHQVPIL